MDRNSVIGLILIAVILVVFSIYNAESPEELARREAFNDSIAKVQQTQQAKIEVEKDTSKKAQTATLSAANSDSTLTALADTLTAAQKDSIQQLEETSALTQTFGIFAPSGKGEAKYYTLENDELIVTFNNKGGRIAKVELKKFESYANFADRDNQIPLQLFDEDSTIFNFKFFLGDILINTNQLFATTTAAPKTSVKAGDSTAIAFRFNTNDPAKYLELTYSLKGEGFVMGMDIQIVGLEKENVAENLELEWNSKLLASERLVQNETILSSVFYKYTDEGRTYLSESSSESAEMLKPLSWIAFKQSYFSVVLMSDKGIPYEGSKLSIGMINSNKYIKEYAANLSLRTENSANAKVPLKFFFGPNDYDLLATYNNEMEGIVNLGWGIFGWTNRWLVIPVFNMLDSLGLNYGIIILLLTVVVKLIIMPLTYRNYLSSAKMRVLKPEVDEIGKKYPDNPMGKQQEVMALYRKSGVNPMAGCIPLLIQMPVLIAVFRFFPSAIELRQQGFLWADDLSGYDTILDFGFSIPLYGDHISLFTLLMAASTILITRMNSGQMDTGMPGMKFMMYFFPVMMIFFFNNMSSGLSFYYFVSNMLTLLIMWAIKKWFIDEQKILAQIHENRKNPKVQKKSAFMQKLEEAQRQRQQQQKKK
jgi:YidC/Oxa1 family membrane protein insertase